MYYKTLCKIRLSKKNIKKALTNDEKCAAALSAKADKAALVNRKIKTIYKEGTPYVITYTGIS